MSLHVMILHEIPGLVPPDLWKSLRGFRRLQMCFSRRQTRRREVWAPPPQSTGGAFVEWLEATSQLPDFKSIIISWIGFRTPRELPDLS